MYFVLILRNNVIDGTELEKGRRAKPQSCEDFEKLYQLTKRVFQPAIARTIAFKWSVSFYEVIKSILLESF